jgi:N-acetylglutamate synthase-like GNAT family acetyltransferase
VPIQIRDATLNDVPALTALDPIAADGGVERRAAIRQWTKKGIARLAEAEHAVLGYCVTSQSFFDQAFVTMLMVAEQVRGQGVGHRLLADAQQRRRTPKLFTSTNLSNQPMRRLLARLGWQSAGIVYGLDEGDPELVYLAPLSSAR